MARTHSIGRLTALLGITVVVGAACGARHDTVTPPPSPPSPVPVVVAVSANVADTVAGQDRFGLDLLTATGSPRDNVVVSPTSVALALDMVAAGARGTTATQLAHVLHLPAAADAATAAAQLLTSLGAAEKDPVNTLRVANTVWAQQGMPVNPAYTATLHDQFGGATREADFAADPEQARNTINKAVSDQTNGMIRQLFPTGSLDASTRMVLTNAIYLAASWARAFDPKDTKPGDFTTADGTVVRVPMMTQGSDPHPDEAPVYGYAQGAGYQAVTLPYTGGKLAFTLLLPAGKSLTPLVDQVRVTGLPSILKAVRPTQLTITMPRFTVRSHVDLSSVLSKLGMPAAFTDAADFSGITTAQRLKIQTVRHDAVVQVDEHGTKAAAATGVGMQATALAVPRSVLVDHPFLFVITDTHTGAPLFLGRVTDPTR
ncbi:MAG TPA: serpin family protein [Pseudonocardiaceae bacterium]|jgi:serpin B|nr:serpin family protein [Pseudonocardiaceae bacterium]